MKKVKENNGFEVKILYHGNESELLAEMLEMSIMTTIMNPDWPLE